MRILIVSNYDSGVEFSVMDNGIIYTRERIEKNKKHKFYELYKLAWNYCNIRDYIITNLIDQYDFIVICENGEIQYFEGERK